MKFSLELRFANAFYHCNYFLPNEKTNNLSMYIFFTFWEPLDLYTFLIQVLKGALLVFVHHGLGLSFLIINITNTTRNQTNKKQKTELYKSYFHQVHSCVVETSKIKKGNKKKNLEPPEFTQEAYLCYWPFLTSLDFNIQTSYPHKQLGIDSWMQRYDGLECVCEYLPDEKSPQHLHWK